MPDKQVDVCIIGAGVAGVACAQGLARQGVSVALLDRLHPLPDCLKAEGSTHEAILSLIRFGFRAAVDEAATPLHNVAVYLGEHALGTLHLDPPEAGLYYPDLINALRKHLDPRVDFLHGLKATAIEQQPNGVQVITDKDTRIACKIALVATGDARHLLEQLGAVYELNPLTRFLQPPSPSKARSAAPTPLSTPSPTIILYPVDQSPTLPSFAWVHLCVAMSSVPAPQATTGSATSSTARLRL